MISLYSVDLSFSASSPGLICSETTSNTADDNFGNTMVDEQATLSCQTTYYGLWGPTQIWTDSSGSSLQASDVSGGNIAEYTYTVSLL